MIEDEHMILNSKLIYNGPVKLKLDTFKLNGKIFKKEVIEHSPSVGIIPIINNNEIMRNANEFIRCSLSPCLPSLSLALSPAHSILLK